MPTLCEPTFFLRALGQKVGSHRIGTVSVEQFVRARDVAERCGHFGPVFQPVPVANHSLWQRELGSPEKQRVVDAVKFGYVFADHMDCLEQGTL